MVKSLNSCPPSAALQSLAGGSNNDSTRVFIPNPVTAEMGYMVDLVTFLSLLIFFCSVFSSMASILLRTIICFFLVNFFE
jgi:hypothetical protein